MKDGESLFLLSDRFINITGGRPFNRPTCGFPLCCIAVLPLSLKKTETTLVYDA